MNCPVCGEGMIEIRWNFADAQDGLTKKEKEIIEKNGSFKCFKCKSCFGGEQKKGYFRLFFEEENKWLGYYKYKWQQLNFWCVS